MLDADTSSGTASMICFCMASGKGADHQAGICLARHAVDADKVAADLHCAFGAGEDEAFALFAAVDKVDAQG